MPAITFDRFDGGLMLARPSSTAPANSLSKMVNFWPQPGGSLRNRPSWKQVPALTTGAHSGLESNGGVLWVFSVGSGTPPGAYVDSGSVGGGGGGGGGGDGGGGGGA